MSVLKSLESTLAGLVEGTFSRAFRSEVRPVEIARRLAREMDEHRTPIVSRVYVPSTYTVFLGSDDYARFSGAMPQLISELSAYLLEHARREKLVLSERPRISVELDDRLGLGEFGIRTIPVDQAAVAPAPGASSPRAVAATPPVVRAAIAKPEPMRERRAVLIAGGTRIEVPPAGAVMGRSSSCEIVLEDPNASRRHAAIRPTSDGWLVEDLGSTNGVTLNGRQVNGTRGLRPGDRIELGQTELIFDLA